jgi:hypothetical protein
MSFGDHSKHETNAMKIRHPKYGRSEYLVYG